MVKIFLEDLVANAFITCNYTFISFRKIEEYGNKVLKTLLDKNIEACLALSRILTDSMLYEYSDFFCEDKRDNQRGIALVEGVSKENLIDEFSGYLPLDVIIALNNKECLEIL